MKSKKRNKIVNPRKLKRTAKQSDIARALIVHAVNHMMDGCGNSYADSYLEEWLRYAKELGAYHGRVVGTILELKQEWDDWLDENGGLPEFQEQPTSRYVNWKLFCKKTN